MRSLSILKKATACIILLSMLAFSTAYAESRSVFEFLLLYQQSMDALKYEYEGIDDYRVEGEPMYFQSTGDLLCESGFLTLDADMNIQDALFDFVDVNADDKKNEETAFRFVAAMCALEYGSGDYWLHDLYYQGGLTENETILDEAMSVFVDSFDVNDSATMDAMSGNEVLLYDGKNYSYYLVYQYVEAPESSNRGDHEAFYIRAIINKPK